MIYFQKKDVWPFDLAIHLCFGDIMIQIVKRLIECRCRSIISNIVMMINGIGLSISYDNQHCSTCLHIFVCILYNWRLTLLAVWYCAISILADGNEYILNVVVAFFLIDILVKNKHNWSPLWVISWNYMFDRNSFSLISTI